LKGLPNYSAAITLALPAEGYEVDYFAKKHGISKSVAEQLIKQYGNNRIVLASRATPGRTDHRSHVWTAAAQLCGSCANWSTEAWACYTCDVCYSWRF